MITHLDIEAELALEFPGETITFSPVLLHSETFTPRRGIIINGQLSKIRIAEEAFSDLNAMFPVLKSEMVDMLVEEITVYLDKHDLWTDPNRSLENAVNRIKKEIYGNG
jgi:hypothetical protein